MKTGNMSSTNACWTWSQQPGIRNSGHFSETCPCYSSWISWPQNCRGREEEGQEHACLWANLQNANFLWVHCWHHTGIGRQTQVSMDFSNQLFKLLIQEIVLGKEALLFSATPWAFWILILCPGHFESWYYLQPARTVLFTYVSRHLSSSSSYGNDGNEKMCRVFTVHPWREMGELRE